MIILTTQVLKLFLEGYRKQKNNDESNRKLTEGSLSRHYLCITEYRYRRKKLTQKQRTQMNLTVIAFFTQSLGLTRDHYESPFQKTKIAPPIQIPDLKELIK